MIVTLIVIGSLVVAFGIFNYIVALLDSKGKDVSDVHSIALKIFLGLVFVAECVGIVFLSKILFGHDNAACTVVQIGSVILLISFSIRVILDHVIDGAYLPFTSEVTKAILEFFGQTAIAFAVAVVLALSARSFMYIYGEAGAIINYLILGVFSIGTLIYDAFTGDFTDSFMAGWMYQNKWVAILLGLCWLVLAAIVCYFVAFIVFMFKAGI